MRERVRFQIKNRIFFFCHKNKAPASIQPGNCAADYFPQELQRGEETEIAFIPEGYNITKREYTEKIEQVVLWFKFVCF